MLKAAAGILLLLRCLKTPVFDIPLHYSVEAEEKASMQLKDGPAEDKGWHLAECWVLEQRSSFVQARFWSAVSQGA